MCQVPKGRRAGEPPQQAHGPAPEPGATQVRASCKRDSVTTSSVSGALREDFLHM